MGVGYASVSRKTYGQTSSLRYHLENWGKRIWRSWTDVSLKGSSNQTQSSVKRGRRRFIGCVQPENRHWQRCGERGITRSRSQEREQGKNHCKLTEIFKADDCIPFTAVNQIILIDVASQPDATRGKSRAGFTASPSQSTDVTRVSKENWADLDDLYFCPTCNWNCSRHLSEHGGESHRNHIQDKI